MLEGIHAFQSTLNVVGAIKLINIYYLHYNRLNNFKKITAKPALFCYFAQLKTLLTDTYL